MPYFDAGLIAAVLLIICAVVGAYRYISYYNTPPVYNSGNEFFDTIINLPNIPLRASNGFYDITEEFRKEFPEPVDLKAVEREFIKHGFKAFAERYPSSNEKDSNMGISYLSDPYKSVTIVMSKPFKYVYTSRVSRYMLFNGVSVEITIRLDENGKIFLIDARTSF